MSLFTSEQLELIRKLRTTGISPDQLIKAFNEIDTCESTPVTTEAPSPAQLAPILVHHLTSKSPSVSPPSSSVSVVTVPKAESASQESPPIPPPPPGTSSVFEQMSAGPPRPIRSQRTPMKEITTLDNPSELDEFMSQGEEACINDMRAFITQYSLRQTTVAMMTGVSQPYISKLLNGNHRELSLRCRKNIYCWYLNCRRHPEKLAAFLADPSTRLETNGDGELIPQRRERYVFRPILIRMLESFFAQTPFPDLQRRAEIATACNHVLSLDKKGVGLMPKEIVSPQVVSNWFANKRKELRRKNAESYANHNTASESLASSSPSREDETSQNGSPPCSEQVSQSPPEMPFDLSLQTNVGQETLAPSQAQPSMDIFGIAQRLGINLAPIDTSQLVGLINNPQMVPFNLVEHPKLFPDWCQPLIKMEQ